MEVNLHVVEISELDTDLFTIGQKYKNTRLGACRARLEEMACRNVVALAG
jgi:hypothetical protein